MMHEAWISIEEVFCSFSRSSVKFQGHTGQNIVDFDPNIAFPDCNASLNWPIMAMEWCTKLEVAQKRCPIVFQCHPSNLKSQGKKCRFSPKFGVSGLSLWFELIDGYEMMLEVPYCFSSSSVKFQGHIGQKIAKYLNWACPNFNSSLNSPMALK